MSAVTPSLCVQVVLYNHGESEITRLVRGAAAAARSAVGDGVLGSVSVAFGDCSAEPLRDEVLAAAQETLGTAVDGFNYTHFGANLGSAEGHNALFARCVSDLLFVTNPDAYFAPDLFGHLVGCLQNESVGIAEARQLPLEHPKRYDLATGETGWASGACMLLRSATFRELDGFDSETFFLYCDDVDLSWRVRLRGLRILLVPSARVFHDKRLTGAAFVEASGAERYYSAEAALLMAWKWSRPDLADTWAAELLAGVDPAGRRAAESFLARRAAGNLPEQIDPEGRVATFVGHDYSKSQFLYD